MRKQDTDNSTHFRAGDRVFCQNGKWFFQTREDDRGPFPSREAAQKDLDRYTEEMAYFEDVTPGVTKVAPDAAAEEIADFTLVDKDT